MPKKPASKSNQRRTQVKDLPKPVEELTAEEAGNIQGGIKPRRDDFKHNLAKSIINKYPSGR